MHSCALYSKGHFFFFSINFELKLCAAGLRRLKIFSIFFFRNLSLFRLQMNWSQSHLTHQVLQLGGHPSGQTAAREVGGAVRHEPGGVEGEQTFISTILCENDIKFLFQKADFGWGPNAHFNVNAI
jgi:hypothetical protein